MKKLGLGLLLLIATGPVLAAQNSAMLQYSHPRAINSMNQIYTPPLWEVELGARLWFSSGSIGSPQPLMNYAEGPTTLASRLTYQDLFAYSGETFARVNHSSGWFAKGFLGAGGISSGSLYDEDFPAGHAYSRTLSDGKGYLSYVNLDLGHSLFREPEANFGAFLGYNYYAQHVNTIGCSQLAGANVCTPGSISPNYPGIVEDDYFNSIRLGLNSQVMLSERLGLITDVAYLPLVDFNGRDDHNARALILPETGSNGDGMMLEAIFNYKINDLWDIGLGGRYWAWNMRQGFADFDYLNGSSETIVEPARYNTERFGVFIQSNYHWDEKSSGLSRAGDPMNWRGLAMGGFLGGGWGRDQWSDPFNFSLNTAGTYTNVAGFGDSIHSTGPLGGVQINYKWQAGSWVFGLGADASRTNFRGENTCFSGLGGINCQSIVTSLGTGTGQVGAAWNRSLLYVKAGTVWINTSFNLNGNTNVLELNTGSNTLHTWGWTAGFGLEHALTNHWVSLVEYDYITIPTRTVAFQSVSEINLQTIRVRQTLNLFKLGLSYKFDF